MNIFYLGDSAPGSTSAHRAAALERLGHRVVVCDLGRELARSVRPAFWWKIHYRTGYRFLQRPVQAILARHLAAGRHDLAWVSGGEFLNLGALDLLRDRCGSVVLYNNDDPTGGRDGRRWDTLLGALSGYDRCAVMRERNVEEFKARGARQVLRVWMSYDEVAHAPFVDASDIPPLFRSEISFVGTWMAGERRDDFLAALIAAGLSVSFWGGRWEKSPRWRELRPFWRGSFLTGREYVAALQGAKVSIGLLSKGNRDEHTQRSFEIPYAGGLLCAERTTEHRQLYREGEEAVFWDTPEECVDVCRKLLADGTRRERIRTGGMRRVRELGAGNEDVCRRILAASEAQGLIHRCI